MNLSLVTIRQRTGLIALSLALLAAPLCPAQDDKALQEIGRALGDVLRAMSGNAGGKPARIAAPAVVGNLAQQPRLAERDRQQFEARLNGYCDLMHSWLVANCQLTEEQRGNARDRLNELIAVELKNFAQASDPQGRTNPFGVCFPVVFVHPKTGAATTRLQAPAVATLTKELLTADQSQQLAKLLAERADFQATAYRDYIFALVDHELYLTPSQRERMTAEWDSEKRRIDNPYYAFRVQNYYLPYQPISTLLTRGASSQLNARQQARLADLNGHAQNPNDHIVFQSSDGAEDWYRQLDEAGVKQREVVLRAMAVRLAFYEEQLPLSPEQLRRLQTACKGVAVQAIDEWRDSARNTIVQMEQQMAMMRGNFAFAAQSVTTDQLENNKIWSDTLGAELSKSAEAAKRLRAAALRKAQAGSILALFDQELWLRPDQRAPLQALIEKSLPRQAEAMRHQDYIREIVLIAYPLFRISDKEIGQTLDTTQLGVWEKMKSFFQRQQGNNYLQVELKNRGGSFGIQLFD